MTNQNDTQDEAGRLADSYVVREFRSDSDERDELFLERTAIFKEGYRAGQASRDRDFDVLNDKCVKIVYIEEQLTASRAEVERLKQELKDALK